MASGVLDRARPAIGAVARIAEHRPPAFVGVIAGLGAALAGYLVVAVLTAIVWVGSSPESWASLLPFTMLTWAASHGLPVVFVGTTISLVPWGWVVVPVLALVLAHRRARRVADLRGPRDAAILIGVAAATYGICVGIAAVLSDSTGANVLVRRALWQSLFIAVVVLALTSPMIRSLLPSRFHTMVRNGVAGFLAIAATATLLFAGSLVLHLVDSLDVAQAIGGGLLGGFGLLLLQLGYLPVLVAWTMAFMTGAPVELSAGGVLSPFLAAAPQAELPALPILAAIPQSVSALAWALPVLVVLAGAMVGAMTARSSARGVSLLLITRSALISAVLAAALVGVACVLATGSIGTQRLAGLGPSWGLAALFAGVLLIIGALPTALVLARARRTPPSPDLEVIA